MNRLFYIIFLSFIGFNTLYLLGSVLIIPYLVEEAYFERSFSFINSVLDDGRDTHGLQFYFRAWFIYAWRFWLVVSGGFLVGLIVSHDAFKRYIAELMEQADAFQKTQNGLSDIPTYRKLLVHGVIVIVLVGSLYDIFTGKEHWPFSPYYMYSYVQTDIFGWNLLYGVTEDGTEVRLGGEKSGDFLYPYEESRAARGFFNINGKPDRKVLLKLALDEVMHRYEVNRSAGRHNEPPLQGVRVYYEEWDLEPSTASRDAPADRRKLLLEVMPQ
ncbi:uncharacterized protein METZ01_LOCUS302674, partial [marine metagenome]